MLPTISVFFFLAGHVGRWPPVRKAPPDRKAICPACHRRRNYTHLVLAG